MSLSHHTLTAGDETKTLAEWGFVSAVATEETGASARLSLVAARALDADSLFPYGTRITLRCPRSIVRFIGTAMEPIPKVLAGADRAEYLIAGPEYDLEQLPYKQRWRFPVDIADPKGEMYEELVSAITLNREYAGGTKVSFRDQVEDVLKQASNTVHRQLLGLDPNIAARMTYSLDNLSTIDPPESEERDLNCLDVLRNQDRWEPAGFWRWEFASGAPQLFRSRVDSIASSGILPQPQLIGNGVNYRVVPVGALSSYEPRPLVQRLVRKLTLTYLITGEDTSGGQRTIYRQCQRDISEVDNDARGEHEMTVTLRGLMYDGTNWTAPEARPADGLAMQLHQAFARMWWDFNFAVTGKDVIWDYKPGDVWNVNGASQAHRTAYAIAQKITRDIGAGVTHVSTGAPGHLGLGDWLDVLKSNRLRNVPQNAGEQTSGIDKHDEGDGHQFWIVENGADNRYRIKATLDNP